MGGRDEEVSSLVGLLRHRARAWPERVFLTIAGEEISYRALWLQARAFAAGLARRHAAQGERVIVALPNGIDFFIAFYGTLLAGGIAVPVFPAADHRRLFAMAARCAAREIVVAEGPLLADALGKRPRREPQLVSVAGMLAAGEGLPFSPPRIAADDIAYIQFTSGTCGRPKGVLVSHANLLTNMRQMIAGFRIDERDVFVSWLPACHDMGLILMTIVPLFLGIPLILLPSTLKNLANWLRAIQAHRATFTAAPDFAYRFCLAYVPRLEQYDLSSLRIALNAAEPVREKTVRDFEARFNLKRVMTPAYGLAEATLGVSTWSPERPLKVDRRGMVSVGRPFPGISLRIRKRNGATAAAGESGEILVDSPANTRGYLGERRATERLFTPDGLLRTGDLGYLDEQGDLFVIGRKKNMIIQAGRSIAPQEVERLIEALPFVRRCAAVGIDERGLAGEQTFVFIEPAAKRGPAQAELLEYSLAATRSFQGYFGFRPGKVLFLRPGSLPYTRNGKLRYLQLKRDFLSGALERERRLIPGE